MSGMLPGVESARRRRFHHRDLKNEGSTRRSSASLYVANYFHEFNIASIPISFQQELKKQAWVQEACDEDELDAATREAKKRLDLKLQGHWKSQAKAKTKR